jgi:UDP-2,4-diacetamido-2,4,6-trideoxy-beta-L-altropyranose hydrolase
MRCIALGQAWQGVGGKVIFVTCCTSRSITDRIMDEGFILVELSHSYPESDEDLNATIETARKGGAKWIVTDGYHFDLAYQRAIRESGYKLLCVDDYNHLSEYEADILLNQNIGADELEYRCNSACRTLLGPRYVMLRKEFRQLGKKCRDFRETGKNLLVTLGGADPGNVTIKVIEALSLLSVSELHVKIIVGPANPHLESLQRAVALSSAHCELISSVRHMRELMCWADLVISAAGSTCWELCRVGVPFMVVVVAENQRRVASYLTGCGIAASLGEGDCVEPLEIAKKLEMLLASGTERKRMSLAGGQLVDGLGVDRILAYPAKMTGLDWFSDRLILRYVDENDSEILFAWINDPLVRQCSTSTAMIERSTHEKWFDRVVSSTGCLLLLAEIDGIPCGHIRYEREDDGSLLLSFMVNPMFRGMGLACPIILSSFNFVVEKFGEVDIWAYSLQFNICAHKTLLNAGFRISREDCDYRGVQCCEFIMNLKQEK